MTYEEALKTVFDRKRLRAASDAEIEEMKAVCARDWMNAMNSTPDEVSKLQERLGFLTEWMMESVVSGMFGNAGTVRFKNSDGETLPIGWWFKSDGNPEKPMDPAAEFSLYPACDELLSRYEDGERRSLGSDQWRRLRRLASQVRCLEAMTNPSERFFPEFEKLMRSACLRIANDEHAARVLAIETDRREIPS